MRGYRLFQIFDRMSSFASNMEISQAVKLTHGAGAFRNTFSAPGCSDSIMKGYTFAAVKARAAKTIDSRLVEAGELVQARNL